MLCGLCKKQENSSVDWVLRNMSPSNTIVEDVRICGVCAKELVTSITSEMGNDSDNSFHMTSLFGGIKFNGKGVEVSLLMDVSSARKRLLREKITR